MDHDHDQGAGAGMSANVGGVGASASADVGTDRSNQQTYVDTRTERYDTTYRSANYQSDMDREEGHARVTVSALSFTPETRAAWVNKFPFYDTAWQLRQVNTYTFAVPDPEISGSSSGLPQFSENMPPGSVFVESAGGAGEIRTGRVIQHSPMLGSN